MNFMQPNIVKGLFLKVETDNGTEAIPSELLKGWDGPVTREMVEQYCEGTPEASGGGENEVDARWVYGIFARLSAPGYLDSTDWSGPYDTEVEAQEHLEEMYGEE
jgi:hypothetical protein